MAHFTAGKKGLNLYEPRYYQTDQKIPKNLLIQMYTLEDQYRSSEHYQDLYSLKDDLGWFRDITVGLQIKVLMATGFLDRRGGEEETKRALDQYWAQRGIYSDDPDINQLTVYHRKDRSRAGSLKQHDIVPCVKLADRSGKEFTLYDYYEQLQLQSTQDRYLFIISGSVS